MPVLALAGVILLLFFGYEAWKQTLPRDVTIPQVEGLRLEDAEAMLVGKGLRVDVLEHRRMSETVQAEHVLQIDPAAGRRVKQGRSVTILVSAGSAYTRVPEILEVPIGDAYARLRHAALRTENEEYQYHATIPFDRIISVAPAPGTRMSRGSSVRLLISRGQKPKDEPLDELRTTVVTVDLPADGTDPQNVRIVVNDDEGERTVYEQEHAPGDTLTEAVQGVGNMHIKVYYGAQLVLTRDF